MCCTHFDYVIREHNLLQRFVVIELTLTFSQASGEGQRARGFEPK